MSEQSASHKPGTRGSHAPTLAVLGRLAKAIVLASGILLLFSSIVSAHAAFVRSEPAPGSAFKQPPQRVNIWFTEPVEPKFSEIKVLNAQGNRVDNGDTGTYQNDPRAISVSLPPGLPEDNYTVIWQNMSTVDGHSTRGSFVFTVGERTAIMSPIVPQQAPAKEPPLLPSPVEPVFRWLGLLSILTIAGCLAFELLISRPILATLGGDIAHKMGRLMESRTLKLVWLAAGLFLVASAGELMVKTASASAIPLVQALGRPMVSILGQTDWGNLWLWRVNLLLGMIAVLIMVSLERGKYRLTGVREWQVVALAFAAGILLTLSLVSHGAAITEIRAAAVFSDYVHLLAAGFWVGGIVYFAVVAPSAMRLQRKGDITATRTQKPGVMCPASHVMAISRFSVLATFSVGVLFITGLYNSWAQVTVLPAVNTPYGITLLAKLGLITPLLLLGAVNLLWVRPRLASDAKALQVLHRTVAGELVLVILVLLAVGLLVSLEPARQVAARQGIGQPKAITLSGTADWAQLTIQVEPGRTGNNRFAVSVKDRKGSHVDPDLVHVSLLPTYLNADLGTTWESAEPDKEGRYVLEKGLNVAGTWKLEVLVESHEGFDARASFPFEISAGGTGRAIVIAPSASTGNWLWTAEILLIGLLFPLVRWMIGRL